MMFRFVVLLSVAALAFGAPRVHNRSGPRPGGRIVGGQDANIEDIPYQLQLLYGGSLICGASIIDAKWAVTAAHCTDGSSASSLSVRASSGILESGGEVIKVKAIHQNPKYDSWTISNDISVLELDSEITLGSTAAPIAIVEANAQIADGANATISGWGTLNEGDWGLPDQLQVAYVPIVNTEDCAAAYGSDAPVDDTMLCAGLNEGGKDACQGDSGGPLVVDGKLTGIVSWGYGCARAGYPGVYSSVPALRDYITEVSGL